MIKCTRCPCYKNEYGVNCIPFSGNPNADLYFLCEMAGKNEARQSKTTPTHFTGKSGDILNYLLSLSNIKREDIAIGNSLRCYKKDNGKPTIRELEACFIHTYNEIQKIKPKLIILLGDTALRLALDVEGIRDYRGKVLWSEKLQCNVLPTYHPMAIGYDPAKRVDIENDFKLINNILNDGVKDIKLYDFIYLKGKEDKRVELLLDELRDAKVVSLDIESWGTDPFKEKLRIVQIGIENEPVYIFDLSILKYLAPTLKHILQDKPIIGQTFDFDIKWLFVKLGIFPNNWYFDTCLAEFMLTGMKDNDLTSLVSKYVPESFGYDIYVHSVGGAHKVKDINKLLPYAACDAGVLFPIMRKQMKQLVKQKMWWYFSNVMMPCNKVLCKMGLRGVQYDRNRLLEVDEQYRLRGQKLLDKALKVNGIDETEKFFNMRFNPKSSQHIKYLLLHYYNLPVIKKTKTKEPSIGKEEMKIYAKAPHSNSYCKTMETYRGIEAIRRNFLSGVLPKLHNDVAHTTYSLHSVATSRPNSKNPNLLNIPSKSKDKEIKSCIVSRPGFSFIAGDFSQLEIRIASVVYNDERLIALCNREGQDFHSTIASEIYNIEYNEFYNLYLNGDPHTIDLRTAAKGISFGILYQMNSSSLAYRLEITEEKAQRYIDEYFKKFPDLAKNIEALKQFVIKNGFVRNFFGFTRFWEKHSEDDHDTIREAVNMAIQSVGWNLVQLALIKLDNKYKELKKSIKDDGLVLQVYDSIVSEVRDENINDRVRLMKDVMENINLDFPNLHRVKLLVDFEIGKNLKDLKKYSF